VEEFPQKSANEPERQPSVAQKRLVDILSYIEKVEKLNQDAFFSVHQHKAGFVAFQENLRGLPSVHVNVVTDGDDEVWLKVERIIAEACPVPESVLKEWMVVFDDPGKEPECKESIVIKLPYKNSKQFAVSGEQAAHQATKIKPDDLIEEVVLLSDRPEIPELFSAYLSGEWKSWSLKEGPRRKTIELYSRLFELHRTVELESSVRPLEVAWGVGVAIWEAPGHTIQYPILTKLVEIVFDDKDSSIVVRPRSTDPQLEVSAFYALDNPGASLLVERNKVWLKDNGSTFSPFLRESFDELLRASVSYLDKAGTYWPDKRSSEDDKSLPSSCSNLIVTDTWVIFARPRTSSFLLLDLNNLKDAVLKSENVGGGPSAIVSDPNDDVPEFGARLFRGICGLGSTGGNGTAPVDSVATDLLFPKPYNREQLCIVDLLERGEGVVVQGPPGTGKTHTIANIICHYLAHGKRVLVTSSGEPALAVIRDQIPEGLRSLVVSILTNEREGLKQVQNSVEQIGTEVTSASSQALRFQIGESKSKLDLLHEKIASWDQEIAVIAERHLTAVPFGDSRILPAELAEDLMNESSKHSWFPDDLGIGEKFVIRVNQSDLNSLGSARNAVGSRISYVDCALPASDSLCDAGQLLEIHANLVDLGTVTEKTRDPRLPRLKNASLETIKKAEELHRLVRSTKAKSAELQKIPFDWPRTLRERVRHRRADPIVQQISKLASEIQECEQRRLVMISDTIELSQDAELIEALRTAVSRSARGEKPFGLFDFNKESKSLYKSIRHNGVVPQNTEGWAKVERYINYLCRIRELTNSWNGLGVEVSASELTFKRDSSVRDLAQVRHYIDLVKELAIDNEDKLRELCEEVFNKCPVNEGFFCEPSALDELERLLTIFLPQHKLKAFEGVTGDLINKISGKTGEVVSRIKDILDLRLGKQDENLDKLRHDWEGCLTELRAIESLSTSFLKIRNITDLIAENGAPIWAEKLRTVPVGEVDTWLRSDSIRAWNWKLQYAYLKHIDCREKLKLLTESRAEAEKELSRTYQEYVRSLTWLRLKENLSNKRRSALQAYLNALKNIGKGKGRGVRTDRFREDARHAMKDAYAAIPCWIMPHWRVSETLPAEIGLFDLVIVDEASQSDIWALPSLLRGQKMLVVGDDEQISPTTFAREEDILRLRDQYLSNLPHNFQAQVLPGKSIYDLARVVFPQSHITLVEHFRCVAPIIEFSNQLCYNGRIQCLRVPKPSERIDPPLVDVFVKGGYREGKKNRPEARAIIREIECLIKDGRYQNRTIGVVSLLGNEQAKLINDLILEKFGEETVQNFNILCGDSMTFQGNERDIMFLSMVATADEAIAQTKREIRQRFNVACSRARDRMYLYRSVQREDLSDQDLRARLIEHFDAPLGKTNQVAQTLREECQSGFELAVFDALVKRGYQVIPQVESSGFFIDMVVEGENDRRLALECDGDQYHGPEKWAEDFGRQRVLERAGWQFWRCWGSSFQLDPEGCLQDLFAILEEKGIEPIARADYVPIGLVEHRIVDPNADRDEWEKLNGGATTLNETPRKPAASSAAVSGPDVNGYGRSSSERQAQEFKIDSQPEARRDGHIDVGEKVEYYYIDSPTQIRQFRLIEIGFTDFEKGLININDSLGTMLLGLKEGSEIGITDEGGTKLIKIVKIHDLPSHPQSSETKSNVQKQEASFPLMGERVDRVPTPDYFSSVPDMRSSSDADNNQKSSGILLPYSVWSMHPLPDPRSLRPRETLEGISEIVAAEAPVVCERVYSLYCQAAGLGRMGIEIKEALDKAVLSGINKGTLNSINEFRTKNRLRNILRHPGKENKLPRELQGRNFDEIPPSEIAAAMDLIYRSQPALSIEDLYRKTLNLFGFRRVSEGVRAVLSLCYRDFFQKSFPISVDLPTTGVSLTLLQESEGNSQ
jgi:very-short-patch-repair endonuclease